MLPPSRPSADDARGAYILSPPSSAISPRLSSTTVQPPSPRSFWTSLFLGLDTRFLLTSAVAIRFSLAPLLLAFQKTANFITFTMKSWVLWSLPLFSAISRTLGDEVTLPSCAISCLQSAAQRIGCAGLENICQNGQELQVSSFACQNSAYPVSPTDPLCTESRILHLHRVQCRAIRPRRQTGYGCLRGREMERHNTHLASGLRKL